VRTEEKKGMPFCHALKSERVKWWLLGLRLRVNPAHVH